jgi:hypothetical protein
MTYDTIIKELQRIADEDSKHLVELHNTYCEECNFMDDYIYKNEECNLLMLIGDNAMRCFAEGRCSSNSYFYTDEWLQLDGYAHPITCGDSKLVGTFIFLSDIARWLAEKDDDAIKELLDI